MSRLYRALVLRASSWQPQALPVSLRCGTIAAFSNSAFSSYPSESTSLDSPTLPVSSSPPGTVLRGLNYIQGHSDPIALAESHYPAWLWSLLDEKKRGSEGAEADEDSDLFAKSKKLRRKAAKRNRKLEATRLASGEVLEVKIPLTQQSIDLPANEEGTLEGAKRAEESRRELKRAMRTERRKMIKQKNYLKSV